MRSEVAKQYPSVSMVEHNPWGPRSRMDWFMDHWIPKGTGWYFPEFGVSKHALMRDNRPEEVRA